MPRRRRRRRRRPTPTPAQIWRLIHAAARERARYRRMAQRDAKVTKRRIAILDLQIREQEKRRKAAQAAREKAQAERDAAQAERDAAQAESWAELRRAWAERDRAWAEREKARNERNVKVEKEIFRLIGAGDNRWGVLIEALVEGNLIKMLRDAGVRVDDARAGVRSMHRDVWREYDLVAFGASDTVVVEVKTTLRDRDVGRFTSRMRDFREWRPDYARERVWGALAYLRARGNAAEAAEKAGFYLMRAVSGTARLVNSEGFTPRRF